MSKKHKKYKKWLGGKYGANLIDPIYMNPLVPEHIQANIPNQIVLKTNEPGVFFGTRNKNSIYEYIGMPQGTEGNLLIVGGNGSGKSSGIVKPTLQTWKGGICATDIKGELSDHYEALFRQGTVSRPYIIFDPTSPETPSYDPFIWLLQDSADNLVKNIWEIVTAIIVPPPDDKQPFWVETEQAVFAAALLHYFKLGLSFSETIVAIVTRSTSLLCAEIMGGQDMLANSFLGETAELIPDTLASIDRGLRNKLMLFATDRYISHAFRGTRENANCFTWADLDKCNIFIRIPADRIEQWSGAITLMYTQLIRYLERRPDKYSAEGTNNIPILLLLDEFARFGKLEMITSAMSTLRSKSVNICPVIQSIAQLDKIYGEHDRRIIMDNCQYQTILRANDAETQRYLCDLIGTTKGTQRSINENMDDFMDTTGYSRSITEIREFRVFPHELSALEDILLLTPYGFCRTEKLSLYNNGVQQINLGICPGEPCITVKAITYPSDIYDPKNTLVLNATSTIFTPEIPYQNTIIRNEGAKMMTIEERATNANHRIDKANHQQRIEQRQEREAQTKKDQHRNYIIGELFTKHFPVIKNLEPGKKAENEVNFQPLESFFSELATDQILVKKLTKLIQDSGSTNGL